MNQPITHHASRITRSVRRSAAAFTMIEIALSLAIIGFALVAIIGVLPTGMGVQKENREETIINQDAAVWMDAIRNGARGYDDLTNYIVAITNRVTRFEVSGGSTNFRNSYDVWYTRNGSSAHPNFGLTNGARIIGLMSRPKLEYSPILGLYSNYVVAYTHAISGAATEKFPQDNAMVRDGGFSYRIICDVPVTATLTPPTAQPQKVRTYGYVPVDTNYYTFAHLNPNIPSELEQIHTRSNHARLVSILWQNSAEVRLTFRWPLLPNGSTGQGRQSFRMLSGGDFVVTVEPGFPNQNPDFFLYFLQPSTYGAL